MQRKSHSMYSKRKRKACMYISSAYFYIFLPETVLDTYSMYVRTYTNNYKDDALYGNTNPPTYNYFHVLPCAQAAVILFVIFPGQFIPLPEFRNASEYSGRSHRVCTILHWLPFSVLRLQSRTARRFT